MAKDFAASVAMHLRGRYFEPFLGGGAVFFALCPAVATLSDLNGDLINVYRQVKDHPAEIISRLQTMIVSAEAYYRVREQEPEEPFERAVRFLYLNRTAFGGIYRLNAVGKFNVPYGGGERTPEPLWKYHLVEQAATALQGTELLVADFEEIIDRAGLGDVVYCDPTYTVAHENNGFIRYNEHNFSWADQERLAAAAIRACARGAVVFISNACHSSLINLYVPFQPLHLRRKSLVSRKVEGRRDVSELLFILANENATEIVAQTANGALQHRINTP